MAKIIHRVTGVEMEVPEERVEVFLQRGHTLAEKPKPKKKRAKKKGA